MTKYPAQIDTTTELPTVVDNLTSVKAVTINRLRDSILAIQSELGVKPRGLSSTVRDRLDALDSTLSIDFIELAGDLGGVTNSPEVIGIRGNPISTVEPTVGDVLVWSGIAWVPQSASEASTFLAAGDLDGYTYTQTVVGLRDNPISDIIPLDGYSLVFSDGNWVPGFLTISDGYRIGGFTVTDSTTDRDAISDSLRKEGMIVYSKAEELYSALIGGTTNSDWVVPNIKSYNRSVAFADTDYLVSYSDTFIAVDTSLAVIVTLPAIPQGGHDIIIKDITGGASGANITINPNGNLIDGSSGNLTISTNYGLNHLIWNNNEWSLIQ
jgi:hypothetical protein